MSCGIVESSNAKIKDAILQMSKKQFFLKLETQIPKIEDTNFQKLKADFPELKVKHFCRKAILEKRTFFEWHKSLKNHFLLS